MFGGAQLDSLGRSRGEAQPGERHGSDESGKMLRHRLYGFAGAAEATAGATEGGFCRFAIAVVIASALVGSIAARIGAVFASFIRLSICSTIGRSSWPRICAASAGF